MYMISTDGSRHQHTDDVAMARILKYGESPKEIAVNYLRRSGNWASPEWQAAHGDTLRCPKAAKTATSPRRYLSRPDSRWDQGVPMSLRGAAIQGGNFRNRGTHQMTDVIQDLGQHGAGAVVG